MLLASLACGAHAQSPVRLSTLLEQRLGQADDYPLGLAWQVPEEVPAQLAQRLRLLDVLATPALGLDAPSRARLAQWLDQLPLTGRVPLALADPRWLQANPARDPQVLPGQRVVMPPRPTTVTVLTTAGERCQVTHRPGSRAADYLAACQSGEADWAWIAQPDGRVQRAGIGLWNAAAQDEPAPGAWVWAPTRTARVPENFSVRLIEHLATQGPALDGAAHTQTAHQLYPEAVPSPAPALAPVLAPAREITTPPSAHPPAAIDITPSDWGNIGLLQTPSARMAPAGEARFTASHVAPYTRLNVFLQPFDWMEAGFRYTSISNREYGPANVNGDQSYKDKSLDVKFRLLTESARVPALTLGFRDMTGTGLFSGEYVVANKRLGLVDLSGGMQWGYGVGSGGFKNPLTAIASRYETRTLDPGIGGKFSWTTYFSGRAALFGGLAIQVPGQPLTVKLEYDPNDYRAEPQFNNQPQRSHLNVGATWRAYRGMDVSLGVERGNTLMVSLNFHAATDRLSTRKAQDSRLAVSPLRPTTAPDWPATAREIEALADWRVQRIEQRGHDVRVTFDQADTPYWRDRVDAATAVLHRAAPAQVEQITFAYAPHGVPTGEHVVDRELWVAQKTEALPPHAQTAAIFGRAGTSPDTPRFAYTHSRPSFESGIGMGLAKSLGGPDGFLLYQLYASHRAELNLRDDTWLQSRIELGLLDNYDKFRYTGSSQLPRVRTYAREYVTTSALRLTNLQATHVGRAGADEFYSVYGGYLESMFAGVGGEWLHRPFASRVAVGLDINAVQQRDFSQGLGLRDYRVTTGHATLYWDTGWQGLLVKASAGQYLAGDRGATIDLSRSFENGVRMGAYFTKTNVSAAQYGEGSFDKGVYVTIPFDAFLTRRSRETALFMWQPLTRDGGAKLQRAVSLYDLTRVREAGALNYQPAPPPPHESAPADHPPQALVTPKPARPNSMAPRPLSLTPQTEAHFERRLSAALTFQDFLNVRVSWDAPGRLAVQLANARMQPDAQAAYRAALTALRACPLDTRAIHIVLEARGLPMIAYEFFDLAQLDAYYNGLIDDAGLAPFVAVTALNPAVETRRAMQDFTDQPKARSEPTLVGALTPDLRPVQRGLSDARLAARDAQEINWPRAALIGGGLILASHALDTRFERFARDHQNNTALNKLANAGTAWPLVATGAAAATALLSSDPALSRTGYAATEAAAAALAGSLALKTLIPRERPAGGDGRDAHQSFPSNHAAVAWAVVTPFAREYNAPVAYALPLLTQLARVQQRRHWVSDTVAGGVLGYGLGVLFHKAGRENTGAARVFITPDEVGLSWLF